MRLGITVDMSGPHPTLDIERVKEAERLGFSQAWTGEAYGTDAVTPATWILAHTTKLMVGTGIMQIPARTPAMAAMTAITLQHLSGGRFLLGLIAVPVGGKDDRAERSPVPVTVRVDDARHGVRAVAILDGRRQSPIPSTPRSAESRDAAWLSTGRRATRPWSAQVSLSCRFLFARE